MTVAVIAACIVVNRLLPLRVGFALCAFMFAIPGALAVFRTPAQSQPVVEEPTNLAQRLATPRPHLQRALGAILIAAGIGCIAIAATGWRLD